MAILSANKYYNVIILSFYVDAEIRLILWPSITQPMSANIADLLQKGIPSEKIVIGKCGSISACNTNGDPQCYGCCKPSDAQYVGGQTLLDNIKSSGKCKGIMFWSLACPKGTVSSGTGLTFPTDSYPGDRPKCPNTPSSCSIAKSIPNLSYICAITSQSEFE